MIKDPKLKRKFMQGYTWIMLARDPLYKPGKDRWLEICKRTQDLRNKLEEEGATLDEIGELITRCRQFANKKFEDMDLDQKVFLTGLIFI